MDGQEINNYFDMQFELRYFEMDKFGAALPGTILILLEEAAADHCYSIGHSLYQLEEQNIGWVLVAGFLEMDRYPHYKEKITIRTWLSHYSTVRGFRENIIYDEQGSVIGRAKGLWVFFDIERRRPVPIFEDIKEKWSFCSTESIGYNVTKPIKPIIDADLELKFKINRYDTDMNKHVSNIRYLQWVLESIPEEIIDNYYLHAIDGRFISEANYGQTIISHTQFGTDEATFTHAIKIEGTDAVCATATTIWKKNDAARK